MQLTSLLRTAAAAAILSVLLLTTFQKAQAQTEAALYNFCSVGCLDGKVPTARSRLMATEASTAQPCSVAQARRVLPATLMLVAARSSN